MGSDGPAPALVGRPTTVGVVAVTTALLLLGIVFTARADARLINSLGSLAVYPFTLVGLLIAVRRPRNAIAWLCLGIGFAFALEAALWGVALFGIAHPGSVPQPEFLAVVGDALLMPSLFLMATLPLLLFPDGHLPSSGWRWLVWATSGVLIVLLLGGVFAPTTSMWGRPRLDNPIGSELATHLDWLFLPLFMCVSATLVSVVLRFRRSRGIERLQMRWLATAGAGAVVLWLLAIIVVSGQVGEEAAVVLTLVAFGLIPAAIGVAVLRYRLFDIDRLVSRTLTYTVVVGVLATLQVAGVLLLRSVLPWQGGDLAVAASTLGVAVLFNPLVRTVQGWVDHRFNRARYDAHQELERFSEQLRDDIGLDALGSDLLTVVGSTLQPSNATLWLHRRTSEPPPQTDCHHVGAHDVP